jgi:hypothetical protein
MAREIAQHGTKLALVDLQLDSRWRGEAKEYSEDTLFASIRVNFDAVHALIARDMDRMCAEALRGIASTQVANSAAKGVS